jgi:predicted PurR-regulated permease PerM
MSKITTLPLYARVASVLITLAILLGIFYIGKGVIVPVLMALLFAILIRPISVFMQRKMRFSSVLASMVTVLLFVIIILGVLTFISWQIGGFSKDWATIEENITLHLANLQNFLKETFGFDENEQIEYLTNATSESKSTITGMVTNFILSFSDTIFNLFMIPIYIFLFLLYQNTFITFLARIVGEDNQEVLKKILYDIKTAVQSYLFGVLIQITAIAVLTAIGLTIVGVEHAILLGAITGLLGLIPYLGNVLAGLITIFATLTGSPDLSLIFQVLIVTTVVQLIDNNITVPLVVSSKVKINAFTSIIGIFIGGMLAGIAGMFLAIPILAILKVVFDNIPSLSPWGYLMGDETPKTPQWHRKIAGLAPEIDVKETVTEVKDSETSILPEEEKEDRL